MILIKKTTMIFFIFLFVIFSSSLEAEADKEISTSPTNLAIKNINDFGGNPGWRYFARGQRLVGSANRLTSAIQGCENQSDEACKKALTNSWLSLMGQQFPGLLTSLTKDFVSIYWKNLEDKSSELNKLIQKHQDNNPQFKAFLADQESLLSAWKEHAIKGSQCDILRGKSSRSAIRLSRSGTCSPIKTLEQISPETFIDKEIITVALEQLDQDFYKSMKSLDKVASPIVGPVGKKTSLEKILHQITDTSLDARMRLFFGNNPSESSTKAYHQIKSARDQYFSQREALEIEYKKELDKIAEILQTKKPTEIKYAVINTLDDIFDELPPENDLKKSLEKLSKAIEVHTEKLSISTLGTTVSVSDIATPPSNNVAEVGFFKNKFAQRKVAFDLSMSFISMGMDTIGIVQTAIALDKLRNTDPDTVPDYEKKVAYNSLYIAALGYNVLNTIPSTAKYAKQLVGAPLKAKVANLATKISAKVAKKVGTKLATLIAVRVARVAVSAAMKVSVVLSAVSVLVDIAFVVWDIVDMLRPPTFEEMQEEGFKERIEKEKQRLQKNYTHLLSLFSHLSDAKVSNLNRMESSRWIDNLSQSLLSSANGETPESLYEQYGAFDYDYRIFVNGARLNLTESHIKPINSKERNELTESHWLRLLDLNSDFDDKTHDNTLLNQKELIIDANNIDNNCGNSDQISALKSRMNDESSSLPSDVRAALKEELLLWGVDTDSTADSNQCVLGNLQTLILEHYDHEYKLGHDGWLKWPWNKKLSDDSTATIVGPLAMVNKGSGRAVGNPGGVYLNVMFNGFKHGDLIVERPSLLSLNTRDSGDDLVNLGRIATAGELTINLTTNAGDDEIIWASPVGHSSLVSLNIDGGSGYDTLHAETFKSQINIGLQDPGLVGIFADLNNGKIGYTLASPDGQHTTKIATLGNLNNIERVISSSGVDTIIMGNHKALSVSNSLTYVHIPKTVKSAHLEVSAYAFPYISFEEVADSITVSAAYPSKTPGVSRVSGDWVSDQERELGFDTIDYGQFSKVDINYISGEKTTLYVSHPYLSRQSLGLELNPLTALCIVD